MSLSCQRAVFLFLERRRPRGCRSPRKTLSPTAPYLIDDIVEEYLPTDFAALVQYANFRNRVTALQYAHNSDGKKTPIVSSREPSLIAFRKSAR